MVPLISAWYPCAPSPTCPYTTVVENDPQAHQLALATLQFELMILENIQHSSFCVLIEGVADLIADVNQHITK